jgi:hypothetical protein
MILQNLSDEQIEKQLKGCGGKLERKQTIIPVKKHGALVNKIIDEEQNLRKVGKIQNMMDKSKCFDIFYDSIVDGKRLIEK